MSVARAAAGPQMTVMAAPLRRAGGEANKQEGCVARAAAGPQMTVMAAPLRRAGGEANEEAW
ncbi:hypothetical protein [Streptomyces sp. I05A-00742]|uniref:hypothetical protein n=1 Tax=Streptomyces sp. I05A-00742 TaxID=2732853 RepID=UPI001488C408|nr:hypothetical protein [Streptomyces sp. I05A-00742]